MNDPARTRGILVALEGIDGAGKTTQLGLLARSLRERGLDVVTSKEPTDGPWGRKIRASAQHGRLPAEEELDAFVSDRHEHVRSLLAPALASGQIVLIDRYYFSTVAYQGARGLDTNYLLARNAFAPEPDVLVVLDIEPEIGLQRIHQRGDRADQFERVEELAKARTIFRALAVPNLHILDATRAPADLAGTILALVLAAWQRTRSPATEGVGA